jgi:L-arabinose isomerase
MEVKHLPVEAMNKYNLRVGLFGIGLQAYWDQFPGLEQALMGYLSAVEGLIARDGVEVINLGLIDTTEKAVDAGHTFRRQDVDIIFLHVTTYALSSTVLPVVLRAKVPVIILNLSPQAAIDYASLNSLGDRTRMTGEWLKFCSPCPVPEIANVFKRTGIRFHQVTGLLQSDDACWGEISEWVEAASVANIMAHNRLGVMGNYYGGMLDMYTDLTKQIGTFGGHIEIIEVDELSALRKGVTEEDLTLRVAYFREVFDVQQD